MKHVVNLRAGACPLQFLTGTEQEAYELAVEEQRSNQTVPYTVAPGITLSTLRGLLAPGDEVRLEDIELVLGSDGYPVPAWKVLLDLVTQGRVLAKD